MFMRFSRYLKNYSLRPWEVFNMIYPDWADKEKLAIYYTGEYPCESYENPGIIRELANETRLWKNTWKNSTLVMKFFMGAYAIYDNRDINEKKKTHVLNYQQAKEIMTSSVYKESEYLNWAVAEKLGVVVDSWYVPLVTAPPEILSAFEEKHEE